MLNFKDKIQLKEVLAVLPAIPRLFVKPLNAESAKEKLNSTIIVKYLKGLNKTYAQVA